MIEWFIEGQAFLRAPTHLSPVSKYSLFRRLPVCRQSNLLTGEGGRVGVELNEITVRKPGPL
jgi:hypothetical protein